MGYSNPFNGKNFNFNKVFGSEINAIKLGEALSSYYDVYILSNLNPEEKSVTSGLPRWIQKILANGGYICSQTHKQ